MSSHTDVLYLLCLNCWRHCLYIVFGSVDHFCTSYHAHTHLQYLAVVPRSEPRSSFHKQASTRRFVALPPAKLACVLY